MSHLVNSFIIVIIGDQTNSDEANSGKIISAAATGIDLTAKQKALHARRLNMHNLTQRQRGARRRKIWKRVAVDNGDFKWVCMTSFMFYLC